MQTDRQTSREAQASVQMTEDSDWSRHGVLVTESPRETRLKGEIGQQLGNKRQRGGGEESSRQADR